MSLLTQASLVLTPNAYKANKLYSIIPSSGSGDMATTRATTATRVNSSGVIESVAIGIPRVDYSSGVGALLLEPQRTSLLLNSVWDGSSQIPTSWSIIGGGVSTRLTSIKNPNVGAYNFISTSVNRVFFYQSQTFTINTTSSLSVYVEQALAPTQVNQLLDVVNATGTKTFLKNNVSINSSEIIQQGNIYTLVFAATATTTGSEVRVGMHNSGTVANVTLSMPQLELGAYATSYIPTTTSTVTRNKDDITKTSVSTDILNASEGTFYVEISALANDLTSRTISLSDNTDFNQIAIQFSNVSNIIRLDTYGQTGVGTTTNYRSNVTVSNTTTFHKCLIRWKAGEIFGYVDGVKYTLTYAAGTVGGSGIPTALNRIDFNVFWGGNTFYGKCKAMQIYKTALSDAECASLTTL